MPNRFNISLMPAPVDGPALSLRARYLKVSDEGSDQREAFVRQVFGNTAFFRFADDGTFALSRADGDYDILILDVVDPIRMARYLRANRALLRNVAILAIMQESSPPRRARMMMAGCDDVFDSARISPDEARLRVDAVMRRYSQHVASRDEDRRLAAYLKHFANPTSLTPRELALLNALAKQQGKPVPVTRLCSAVAPLDPVQFSRSLKFSISRLRSKLHAHWRIEFVPGKGYALLRLDPCSQDEGTVGEAGYRWRPGRQRPRLDVQARTFERARPAA